MKPITTVSKKVSEQNNEDRSDFGLKIVDELNIFMSKLMPNEIQKKYLKKIEDENAKVSSAIETLEALKSRADTQVKILIETHSKLLAENELLKQKLGLN